MDVYVTLPKPTKQAPGNLTRMASNITSTTSNSTSTTAAAASEGNSNGMLPIGIHQIIGLFCCGEDKAAANLDCGLFEYDYFHDLFERNQGNPTKRPGSPARPASPTADHGKKPTGKEKEVDTSKLWTPPNSKSGISVLKQPLPSGLDFQMMLIANYPSREYLEEVLPKKIKLWLGLPV
jgi:hypothetical protein